MNGTVVANVLFVAAMWTILWTTWVTTRPERPSANAVAWQRESFASTNRQFHIVMAIHFCWFLFVLAMLVDSWQ